MGSSDITSLSVHQPAVQALQPHREVGGEATSNQSVSHWEMRTFGDFTSKGAISEDNGTSNRTRS